MCFPEFYCSIYKSRSALSEYIFSYNLISYLKVNCQLGTVPAITSSINVWSCWLEPTQPLVKVKCLCNLVGGDDCFQNYAELYHWQKQRDLRTNLVALPAAFPVALLSCSGHSSPPSRLTLLGPRDALLGLTLEMIPCRLGLPRFPR